MSSEKYNVSLLGLHIICHIFMDPHQVANSHRERNMCIITNLSLNFSINKGPISQLLMTGSRQPCTQGYYTKNNSYWAALYSNLWKSQRRRGMAEKVPGKTCVPIKARAMMYKAVVLELLLYGSNIWLATDAMMKVLVVFHHSIARQISGMTAREGDSGEWE